MEKLVTPALGFIETINLYREYFEKYNSTTFDMLKEISKFLIGFNKNFLDISLNF